MMQIAPADIRALAIDMSVDGESALHLTLSADGGVRRSGDGSQRAPRRLEMGQIDPAVFRRVVALVTPELIERAGRYTDPNPKGLPCSLRLVMNTGSEETGIEFRYGSQSLGPPPPLAALVEEAVAATDDWYGSLERPPSR